MKTTELPARDDASAPADESDHGYVMSLVHVRMPERFVQFAFWGALGATVVAGAVDLPVAAAVAGGVVIARHVRR
jgi:hypothetical protein